MNHAMQSDNHASVQSGNQQQLQGLQGTQQHQAQPQPQLTRQEQQQHLQQQQQQLQRQQMQHQQLQFQQSASQQLQQQQLQQQQLQQQQLQQQQLQQQQLQQHHLQQQQLDQGDPGGDMHQQMDGQVQQQMDGQVLEATPMSSTECVHCGEELSYPSSSLYIQCPKCCQTMNPHSPHAKYMNCIGCNTLLSHPPSSLTIQCPKCLVIMELPVQVKVMRAPPQVLPGESLRRFRKKRKDPNAPKRASNAYMIFCKERRAELKETRPELAFGKLGAKLGEIWRTMSSEEKKPYEDRAAMDRDRYQKEMLIYQTKGIMNMEPAAKRQHVGDANEPGGRHHVQQELGEGGGVDPQSMGADMRMWNGRAEDNALSTLIGMPGQQQGQGGAPPATKTEHGQPSSSPTPQTDSTSGNHVAYGMAGPGGSVKNDVDSEDSEEADEDGMNDEDEEQAMPKVAKEPSTSHVDQTGQAEAEVQ